MKNKNMDDLEGCGARVKKKRRDQPENDKEGSTKKPRKRMKKNTSPDQTF